jgi:hypothetical protein
LRPPSAENVSGALTACHAAGESKSTGSTAGRKQDQP